MLENFYGRRFEGGGGSADRYLGQDHLRQDFIRNVDCFNPKSMVSKSASSLMASGRGFQG